MSVTALSCGNVEHPTHPGGHAVRWVDLPAAPGRTEVDPLLSDVDGRLLVHGTDADLAAVILRLLRRNRLADVAIGYVPVQESPATRLWRIPTGPPALELALGGDPHPAPLVRDDAGGVLIASGVIKPITGQAYCDDQRVLNGSALSVEVSPDPEAAPLPEPAPDPLAAALEPADDGLRVSVVSRALLRRRTDVVRGRAFQASFRSTTVSLDGLSHPRPARSWCWYRHTEDLLLVRTV